MPNRSFTLTKFFADSSCDGTPQFIHIANTTDCANSQDCVSSTIGDATNYTDVGCYYEYHMATAADFASHNASYVLLEIYNFDETCASLTSALAFYADGMCRALPSAVTNYGGAIAVVDADLSVNLQLFIDSSCSGSNVYAFDVPSANLTSKCIAKSSQSFELFANSMSTSGKENSDTGSRLSKPEPLNTQSPAPASASKHSRSLIGWGTIIGIVAASVLVGVVILGFIIWRTKRAEHCSVSSRHRVNRRNLQVDYGEELLAQDAGGIQSGHCRNQPKSQR